MATPPTFRPVPPVSVRQPEPGPDLGALTNLTGTWTGGGFNLIARPDHQQGRAFFLELNKTQERLQFTKIGSPIPDRGSAQDDIVFLGLHYLQQISDAVTNGALHLEPGIWINVPATEAPKAAASVVRMATIPHGDSLLAQGSSLVVDGGPTIGVISSHPLEQGTKEPFIGPPGYLDPYQNTPLPPGIPPGSTEDPNLVLKAAIEGQNILRTTVLTISTVPDGGIENIPFVVVNANAVSMEAIFWIEEVEHPDGYGTFLQLQYTQTVLLRFLEIDWPHITVATLTKTW